MAFEARRSKGQLPTDPLMSTSLKLVQDLLEHENRMELERILASPNFRRAPALCKFLSYICESYFKGLDHEIKEYNIAVSALGRRSGFDPQVDPIVRVSAHSLRKRLESYYQGEGRLNPIRIILPVGSYVPVFHKLSAEDGSQATASSVLKVTDVSLPPAVEPEEILGVLRPASDQVAGESISKETSSLPEAPLPVKGQRWPVVLAVLLGLLVVSSYVLLRQYPGTTDRTPGDQHGGVTTPFVAVRLGSGLEW